MAVLYNVMLSDTGDNKTTYYSSNTKTTVVTNSAVRAGSESIEVRENSNFYLAVSYANSYKSVELPVCPDEISDSTTANFPLQSVIGSSSPFAAYVGTGAREISFSMTLHREMPGNIENVLELLRASVYPKYTNSAVIPPVTRFVFGKFGVKGVVTNVNFTWKKPLVQNTFALCEVSVSITGLPTKVVDATELGYSLDPFKNSAMPNYTSTLW